MIKVFFSRIDTLSDTQTEQTKLKELPLAWQQKILGIKDQKKRIASLTGKLLLLKIITFFNVPSPPGQIQYTQNGKPFFGNPLHFSISYSEDIVVCAGTLQNEIGIDAEKMVPLDLSLYQMYFTLQEWGNIIHDKEPYQKLYEYWTRKEALLKAAGTGISNEMSSIEVIKDKTEYHQTLYYLQKVMLPQNYICHLACTSFQVTEVSEANVL